MKTYDRLKVLYPCYIQPKLNGVGFRYTPDGYFMSRNGKYFHAPWKYFEANKLLEPYKGKCQHTLLGEFYKHGIPLESIAGAVGALNVTPENEGILGSLQLYIYDIDIPGETQEKRLERLKTSCDFLFSAPEGTVFKKVPTYKIYTESEGDELYTKFLQSGYEGAVYRPLYGTTQDSLLKRKPYKDEEFVCIDIIEGVGKRKGHVGSFIVTDGRNVFKVGGGQVSYDTLRALFINPPIGKKLTCRYSEKTAKGIPRCAQLICVRNYE